jgi:hypothetical protein
MRFISNDADVVAYVLAVEAADGDRLEDDVISAYDAFITGCKTDGIWSALKASCILAGARTLSGALVPLVGTAPTNVNFVSGDYNRETGLKGNGSTKRITTNRNNNDDPQDNSHRALHRTETVTPGSYAVVIGRNQVGGNTQIGIDSINRIRFDLNTSTAIRVNTTNPTGLIAVSRPASTSYNYYFGNNNYTHNNSSVTPSLAPLRIFSDDRNASFSLDRISFYSIGESLDLAALDSRVSNLITDLAAAIP